MARTRKRITELEEKVERMEVKIEQLDCSHKEDRRFVVESDRSFWGEEICVSCGKRLEVYSDAVDFLEEKIHYLKEEIKKTQKKLNHLL